MCWALRSVRLSSGITGRSCAGIDHCKVYSKGGFGHLSSFLRFAVCFFRDWGEGMSGRSTKILESKFARILI